ncbi:UDP-3-O-(3-hydroxymyristoyl)glucosamine N-acyltransferase [Methyloferula stellata]|uniref:UDP-3-O-(3-hydroxymyristoyl)glucosamine N-acyltransferase n=1 Tax=Methyloferula stellata TaxID=876270 RepID=UPI00037BD6FB|nr:UDP-3-O-(3-hydroxymyristoyl)glucosamine N-acyltransferase [Methyloferula stellata]
MSEPIFWRGILNATLGDVVAWTYTKAPPGAMLSTPVHWIAPLEDAEPGTLVFFDHPKYQDALATTRATACLVTQRNAALVPPGTVALVTESPSRAFALALAKLCPASLQPGSLFGSTGISPGASVHPDARLEPDVIVDPGAVIGPRAEIGAGTTIGPNAVIGPDVCLGRNCSVGAQVTIIHALIGNRVIIHPGVRIGQDGFGFVPGRQGHLKVPQIGRVIIQDDVEIGANTTIDRGSTRDTVIGEGAKIDNLVQIAHNVTIGRSCLIVSQVGISGSTELGDFVAAGGQAGIAGHLKIGAGAEIAAQSGVIADVPAKARLGGTPAQPFRRWLRAHVVLDRLARGKR